jgi:hypothetical protein
LIYAILSSAYFPPIQYFSKVVGFNSLTIEQYENYAKQSYRNRCRILSPSGIQSLSIPVGKISGKKQLVKDIKIDYTLNWQSNHFKSIQTAYFSSPFYEYYIDAFLPFFKKKTVFLFDFNQEIIDMLLHEMQIKRTIVFSESFQPEYQIPDYRTTIHPKTEHSSDKEFISIPYTQVFFDKFDFAPNLSIIDLLFNEGPAAINLLEDSFVKST